MRSIRGLFEETKHDIDKGHLDRLSRRYRYFDSNCLPGSILGWAKKMRDLADKIDESRDSNDRVVDIRILIDRYKRELSRYGRRLKNLRNRDEYYNRLRIKASKGTTVVNNKVCPFYRLKFQYL